MPLPILEKKTEITEKLLAERRLALAAPAGSGKSTQVPQMLLECGKIKGLIAVLQPRRLAARMLAKRISQERNSELGKETGYRVRLEDKTSRETKIVFETDGILLRDLIRDPKLQKYGCIIFDEFHERHIASDIALAACLELQKKSRPDLLIAVMSATLDIKKISSYLAPCGTVIAEGRMYPVAIKYCDSISAKMPIWESAAKAAAMLAKQTERHTLIFMPGAYEINRTIEELKKRPALNDFQINALHGSMRNEAQDQALAETGRRKIIVSTNIAETSLTIDGVSLVIDSGKARIARYDASRAMNILSIEKITKASAAQRAGRAGRTGPGLCLRLWTEFENRALKPDSEPELLRLDLSEALLILKACGYKHFQDLSWLDMPDSRDIEKAEALLAMLGAADKNGELTANGRSMAWLPVPPRYARMLLEGIRQGCAAECSLIAAAAQGKQIWISNKQRENDSYSDLSACASALRQCEAENFSFQACERLGIDRNAAREACMLAKSLSSSIENIKASNAPECNALISPGKRLTKAFLTAFPDRIAALIPGSEKRYALPGGRKASLDQNSAANGAKIIVAGEALEKQTGKNFDIILSNAAAADYESIAEIFPYEINEKIISSLDKETLSPITQKNTYYKDILLKSERMGTAKKNISSELIAEEFISGRHKLAFWNDETEEWLARIDFLSKACPDFGIEPLSDEDIALIINDICSGAKSVSDAKSRQVLPHLKDWYGWEKCRIIEEHAPARMKMPNGRKARIKYPKNGEPYLEAKIQDLYGFKETPKIAAGRVPLVIHILAPSMRPVQVTKDLKSFWSESYPKLKPALARRYPKHKWL